MALGLDLIEAVLAEQIAGLVDLGRGLLTTEHALDALRTWLRTALTHASTYRGLAVAVMNSALDRRNGLMETWHGELFEVEGCVAGACIGRGRRRHGRRGCAEDGGAIAWAVQDAPDSPAQADRLLALLMRGLTPWPQRFRSHPDAAPNLTSRRSVPLRSAAVQTSRPSRTR